MSADRLAEASAVSTRRSRADGRRRRGRWNLVGVLGELLISAGVFLLLFVAWQLWWTDVEAGRASSSTVSSLRSQFEERDPAAPDPMAPGGVIEGRAFALLHIPRLGADWVQPVMEGTGLDILSGGVGHYVDTALPGAVGNFSVAGHRTTWGRPFHDIENLVAGDRIVVETKDSWEVYAVTSHEIVAPTAMEVIAAVPDQPDVAPTAKWLTLTTCHPKFSAAQRYVVHAQWVESHTRTAGLPASVLKPPSSTDPSPSPSGSGSGSGSGSPAPAAGGN